MNLSTQFKIKNNPLLQKYIRENSYWYKYLNRNPNLLTEMEKEMKEMTKEIIEKLDNTEEIKQMKELRDKLNKNEEYLSLIDTFLKNKKNYIKDNKLDDEILNLRKKLFNIDELKEFLKIQNDLRLLSININNIILSVLD